MIDREELVALLMAANLTADQLADTERDALVILWMQGPCVINTGAVKDYEHLLCMPGTKARTNAEAMAHAEAVADYDKLLIGDGWQQTLTLMREMEAAQDDAG